MERFGDDLTEEVLQYLTFEDKIRLECVSKQWQRCVYQRQTVIAIDFYRSRKRKNSLNGLFRRIDDERQSDEQRVVSVVKKCPNITKVILRTVSKCGALSIAQRILDVNPEFSLGVYNKLQDFQKQVTNDLSFLKKFGFNNELKYLSNTNRLAFDISVLSLISRYCHRIKSLDITISGKEDLDFFRDYGHKLEELCLKGPTNAEINYQIKEYLKLCPNIKKVYVNTISILLNDDKEFLPKLEIIQNRFEINSLNIKQIEILSDKYSQTMKILNIIISYLTAEELKTSIECIARFENLKELKLYLFNLYDSEPIDNCLSLIGQKCNKLLKLDLSICPYVSISNRFFRIFSEFKSIKKLKIKSSQNTVLLGSVECFKHCKQLNDIDINYSELREDFFANIASFVPKLQYFHIRTKRKFSHSFIDSFNSMKFIQKVDLKTQEYDKIWYFGKRFSKRY